MSEYHIERGDIFYIDKFGFQVGSEQHPGRPGVVVSNHQNNEFSETVEVVYMTTRVKPDLPTHVTVFSTPKISTALCEQITTVSKERFGNYIGRCSDEEMAKIDAALKASLGLHDPEPVVIKKEVEPRLSTRQMKEKIEDLEKQLLSARVMVETYKSVIDSMTDRMMANAAGGRLSA